jgi:two-component system response regulator (stage 0 sporulation protein A)
MSKEAIFEMKMLMVEDGNACFFLQNYLNKQKYIRLIGAAQNAEDAFSLINIEVPDLIVLDWATMGEEIFLFLKRLKKSYTGNIDVLLMLDADNHEYLSRLDDTAFDYFIKKPFAPQELYEKILDIADKKNNQIASIIRIKDKALDRKITSVLLQSGVPANIMGYQYLRSAIQMTLYSPEQLNKWPKVMYAGIASSHHTNAKRVERNIRHAIEIAWSRKTKTLMKLMRDYLKQTDRPTNMDFILTLRDRVKSS